MSDAGVSVTVAVSTWNRMAQLRHLLDALAAQDLPKDQYEVIVFDNGCTDGTSDMLRAWSESVELRSVVLRVDENIGPAAGRNRAWQAGSGPVVAFIDDDCTPAPNWLSAGLRAMSQDPRVVGGRVRPRQDQMHRDGPFSLTIHVNGVLYGETCNIFYRRVDLERLGGFDETFRIAAGEDTDLFLRAKALGIQAVFEPDALVEHDVVSRTGWQAFRQTFRWMDLALVIRRNPEARSLLYLGTFWKRSHPWTILAVIGMLVAIRRRFGLLAVLPWMIYRWRVEPLSGSPKLRVQSLPAALLVDAGEVATCVAGSVRHRSLLL